MLNSSCHFSDPFHITITHYFCALFSIPVYGIAFAVLLLKCPSHFNKYRNNLVIHITSGVLLEVQMGFWRVNVTFPWGALCANGLLAEYSPNLFQLWIMLFHFTAFSTITLFVHRMEIVVSSSGKTRIQSFVYFLRNAFYVNVPILFAFNLLIYPDLMEQKGYKMKMEQTRHSLLPPFMWCSNCFFMQFDSWIFLIFYILAYTAVLFAFLTGGLAAYTTIKTLNSINLRLSARTIKIHKNFLFSLVLASVIHISFIFIPLFIFFAANFLYLEWSAISYHLTLMVQEHGTASTLVMLLTNTLLRRAVVNTVIRRPFLECGRRQEIPSILISYVP